MLICRDDVVELTTVVDLTRQLSDLRGTILRLRGELAKATSDCTLPLTTALPPTTSADVDMTPGQVGGECVREGVKPPWSDPVLSGVDFARKAVLAMIGSDP